MTSKNMWLDTFCNANECIVPKKKFLIIMFTINNLSGAFSLENCEIGIFTPCFCPRKGHKDP